VANTGVLLIADQMAPKKSHGAHHLRGVVPIRFHVGKPFRGRGGQEARNRTASSSLRNVPRVKLERKPEGRIRRVEPDVYVVATHAVTAMSASQARQ
jgi:hypothetical protein